MRTLLLALLLSPALSAADPPNVVLIVADDLGYGDLGCYGSKSPTPHLDAMAKGGVRFTDYYAAQAVCSASRAAILTGCYPNRVGIHGALGPNAKVGLHPREATIAELLKAKGYATAAVGKWHLGHRPQFLPTRRGFDSYLGLPYSNDMWPHHPEMKKSPFPPLPLMEGEKVLEADVTAEVQKTLTGRYTERAVEFIKANKAKPFFLYVAHSMPHVPLFAGKEFAGKTGKGIYADVVAEIDDGVGRIMATLAEQGIDKNTLVMFTSDNGPWLSYGEHAGSSGGLREGKGTAFEGGVRVPFVARWPGRIAEGGTCAEPVMAIDLLPTVAKLAGTAMPERPIDGKDIGPLLVGEKGAKSPHEALYFYSEVNQLRAVRAGRWKLVLPHTSRTLRGVEPAKGGVPAKYVNEKIPQALYDLEADRAESADVSEKHPDQVKVMLDHVEKARADLGDALTNRKAANAREPGREIAAKPNIVFVIADDLGYGDLGCFGQKKILTPNLDRLAGEGIRLTRHYAGNNVCAPSRAVLMTGLHPGHAAIRDNREAANKAEGQLPLPGSAVTLAEVIKAQGYTTGAFGKWGLGSPGSEGEPLKQGFDRFYGFNCQRAAHNSYPTHLWDDAAKVTLDNPAFAANQKLGPDEDPNQPETYARFAGKQFAPDLIGEQAVRFVEANKDRPFFLFVPTTVPHLALQVPADSLKEYEGKFEETAYSGGNGYLPHRTPRAAYAAMVSRMDRDVGRVMGKVKELGLDENTIFVFTSDNGPLYGKLGGTDSDFFDSAGGLRGRKGSMFEGGVRVPCVVRWPGVVAAGKASDRVTGFEDWLPTLLELTGGSNLAKGLDGISFAETLKGNMQPERPFLYRESPGYGGQQMAIAGKWKAVRQNLNKRKPGDVMPTLLFDLRADPKEQNNVADSHPEAMKKLEAILREQHSPSKDFPIAVLEG